MSEHDDDDLFLVDDDDTKHTLNLPAWKILVVDDDQSVHDATQLSIENESFEGHPVQLIHAFSAAEAQQIINDTPDIAVILLDVIMEDEHAGLTLAQYIRENNNNKALRIILRTGQPGIAPEAQIFEKYDIHDYKEKSGLTSKKLKTSILSAIRSYRDIIKEINQHNLQSELFVTLTELARGSSDIDTCLKNFLETICKIFYSPVGHFYTFSDSKKLDSMKSAGWYIQNGINEPSDFQLQKQAPNANTKESAVSHAFIDAKTIEGYDINKEPFLDSLEKSISQRVLKVLAIPIIRYNEVFSILELFITKEISEFQQYLIIVQAAISQFGVILERLDYEEKTKKRYDELERTFTTLKVVQEKILSKTRDFSPAMEESDINSNSLENTFDILMNQMEELSKELLQAQLRIHSIINAMPSVLISISEDFNIVDWNQEAEKNFELTPPEVILKPLFNMCKNLSPYKNEIETAMNKGELIKKTKIKNLFSTITNSTSEQEEQYYDLVVYPVTSGNYKGAVIRIDDVTTSTKFQEIIAQNEKMISIGGLASGVAHELNNPLGIIQQHSQNILRRFDKNLSANIKVTEEIGMQMDKLHDYLEKRKIMEFVDAIQKSSERASYIASNLLQFSRLRKSIKSPCLFEEIIESSLQLAATDSVIRKKINFHDIEIKKIYAENIPKIYAYMIEIEQVLLNIIKNAAQAMSESNKKPCLTLTLSYDKEFVTLDISDNGPGMNKEILDSIFRPFFTTKPPGEGTGLGLSVSYGIIVENHKGKLDAKSEVGKGTTFSIALPVFKSTDSAIKH